MKIVGLLAAGSILMGFLAGCESHQDTSWVKTPTGFADIRFRVFEASLEAVERLAARERCMKFGPSKYWAVEVSKGQIDALVAEIPDKPGVLADTSRTITWWSDIGNAWSSLSGDAWSYTMTQEPPQSTGGGAGMLWGRGQGKNRQLRLEYEIFHAVDTPEPIRGAKAIYEGPAPQEGILFFKSFERGDGAEMMHVVLFEIGEWK
jgi:hypothetical protein